jgi:hypothetical protein
MLASSRLKPVPPRVAPAFSKMCGDQTGLFPAKAGPTKAPHSHCGTGFSRAVDLALDLLLIFIRKRLEHRQSRLGCRLNAGLAQWAEPHGSGESAVRTWMSVRRGPTERDRSEGTLRNEGPNQEQAPLVTWGWCDFRLFQVTRRRRNPRPLGRRALISRDSASLQNGAYERRGLQISRCSSSLIRSLRPPSVSRAWVRSISFACAAAGRSVMLRMPLLVRT